MTADAAGGEPPAGTPQPTGPDHPDPGGTGRRPRVRPYVTAAPKPPGTVPETDAPGPRSRTGTTPVPRRRRPGGSAAAPEPAAAPPGASWPEWAGDIRGDPPGSGTGKPGKDPDRADEPPPFRIGSPAIEPRPRSGAGGQAGRSGGKAAKSRKAPAPKSRSGAATPPAADRSGAAPPPGSRSGAGKRDADAPRDSGSPEPQRWALAERPRARGEEPGVEVAARPRPFVLTAGRVAAGIPYIGLETQVSVRPGSAPSPDLPPQQSAIVTLCAQPTSVAEIAAMLGMHLGVTRILVADLYTAGLLDVPGTDASLATDPDLIMRVIRGIRDLT